MSEARVALDAIGIEAIAGILRMQESYEELASQPTTNIQCRVPMALKVALDLILADEGCTVSTFARRALVAAMAEKCRTFTT